MADACITSEYFSGQGALLLAERDAGGVPTGFREVGNVSALTVGIETTEFEHKESCTGVRGIDLTIVQELAATATFTMESLSKENLSLALFGSDSAVAAGSVADEIKKGYHDLWTALDYINITTATLVVGNDATPTITYTEGTDYEVDLKAGAIKVLSTGAISDAQDLYFDYDYSAQENIQALTSGSKPVRYARFQGLNTADSDKPFVVDMFKMQVAPLAELALINDEIAQMEVETELLSDALQTTASKYFQIKKVA